MWDINTLLTSAGVSLGTDVLTSVNHISSDGQFLDGLDSQGQGFVVRYIDGGPAAPFPESRPSGVDTPPVEQPRYGSIDLFAISPGQATFGLGLSGDGSVAVGYGNDGSGVQQAFRRTAAGGIATLGFIGTGGATPFAIARAANGDGSVVVGNAANGRHELQFQQHLGLLRDQRRGVPLDGGRHGGPGLVGRSD